jgi:hypothetical protein
VDANVTAKASAVEAEPVRAETAPAVGLKPEEPATTAEASAARPSKRGRPKKAESEGNARRRDHK